MSVAPKVLAVCGGVGGAKLVLGLDRILSAGELAVLVNTGDDFEHLGLHVSPDLDTVMYTLAGVVSEAQGWGREGDTRRFLEEVGRLGGPTWFALGDLDLATHVERTRRLRAGESHSDVTATLAGAFGIRREMLPMSDDPVRTLVQLDDGAVTFQDYFTQLACEPPVKGFLYGGAAEARIPDEVLDALHADDLEAVVIGPSNPYHVIRPILEVAGMRELLRKRGAPVIAVSPIVGGKALKGTAGKMMTELGHEVSPRAVALEYLRLIDGFVIDGEDEGQADGILSSGIDVITARTVMKNADDRQNLARTVLDFAHAIRERRAED